MNITLKQLKNAVADIKQSEEEWILDIESNEYQCMCEGLDLLVRHFEELKEADNVSFE